MKDTTVKMSAIALRELMDEAFDYDECDKGRKDARKIFAKAHPDIRKQKLEEIKQIISNGDYRNRPGPSYWIGALWEANFYL